MRAICFDLFTLFDPRFVVTVAADLVPDAASFCEAWRTRQFQYAFLRAAAERYEDFERVTTDALDVTAAARGVSLSERERRRLVDAYSQLPAWPDTRDVLMRLRGRGVKLATLANYTPGMIRALLENSGLAELFDARISTHTARTFKPSPRAYALGPEVLLLRREEIVFSAFGGWDAAGATWFGFRTFWVNRLGGRPEELAPAPAATGPTLLELEAYVARELAS